MATCPPSTETSGKARPEHSMAIRKSKSANQSKMLSSTISLTDAMPDQVVDLPKCTVGQEDPEEVEYRELRENLVREIKGHGVYDLSFDRLVDMFWPEGSLQKSMEATKGTFAEIVKQLPVVTKQPKALYSKPDKNSKLHFTEAALAYRFAEVWHVMEEVGDTRIQCRSKTEDLPELVDYQTTMVPNTKVKIDFLFCRSPAEDFDFSTALVLLECKLDSCGKPVPDLILGQIAHYVKIAWEQQPTRKFVPILLLNGLNLKLFLFTRDKWYCVEVGKIGYNTLDPDGDDYPMVERTLQRLWFLISSLPSEIGHVCNIPCDVLELQFKMMGGVYTMSTADAESEDAFEIGKRIHCSGRLRGRLGHVIRGKYNGKDAIMKITWTPVRRFPEGAAYHILEQSKVGQIPHVYLSGILVKEFCGHRMEFLIIEDCGKSPLDFFAGKFSSLTGEKASTLVSMIRQVSSCLVWVRCAGILHRDISMGNIAIRQGDKSKGCVASIIDFGYAKLLPNDIAEGVLREVSAKWSFEPKTVSYTEDSLDAITGTPMYMSIPILFGKKQRGLHDDIESLFYVVLHLIWELQIPASENRTVPAPLNFLESENMAFVRAGTLGSKTGYLRSFGIRECPDELRRVLDAMYDYLFINGDGKNIACCFNEDWCTRKSHDTDAAALFMDLEAVSMLRDANISECGSVISPAESPGASPASKSLPRTGAPVVAKTFVKQPATPAPFKTREISANPGTSRLPTLRSRKTGVPAAKATVNVPANVKRAVYSRGAKQPTVEIVTKGAITKPLPSRGMGGRRSGAANRFATRGRGGSGGGATRSDVSQATAATNKRKEPSVQDENEPDGIAKRTRSSTRHNKKPNPNPNK